MSKIVQLAPMLGLVDNSFMNALGQIGGFDEMFAPYILADSRSLAHARFLRKRFASVSDSITLVPQLLSNDAVGFLHYANTFYDLGYTKVNWNMGCPQHFVVKRGRGAGMLIDIEATQRLLETILPKLKPQLSVKIRLGYWADDEFQALIEMFNNFEFHELIVHARNAMQQYDGEPNKELFCAVASQSRNKVVYNGDIVQAVDVGDVQVPNLKGYMVGRGALANPFIGLQIKGVEVTNKTKQFMAFCDVINESCFALKSIGGINRLKELWKFMSPAFELGDEVFAKIKPIDNAQDFRRVVKYIFEHYQLAI